MELSAYEIALIGGAFTISGALIAVLSGHYLAKHLASYTYRLSKLDEIRSLIISNYRGLYPVASKWPDEIENYLKSKSPELCSLIQQCEPHLSEANFALLLKMRDKHLEDIEGYIQKQNDAAEMFYGNSDPKKGQSRLKDNLNDILSCIK